MPMPIFWENKTSINLLSAEFAHRVVKVKAYVLVQNGQQLEHGEDPYF